MDKLRFIITKDGFRIDDIYYAESELQQYANDFVNAPYDSLYELAFRERPACFDAAGVFLCQLAERFAEELTAVSGLELSREKTEMLPSEEKINTLLDSVPFILGAEFVTRTWIKRQYRRLLAVFAKQIKVYPGKVSLYFAEKSQKLHVPERVFFHLVESNEDEFPFAFLATYATKGDGGRVRHVPLQYALTEYRDDRSKLLELLSCLNKAAEVSSLIGGFMESGELFHPLRLTAEEAYHFLNDVEALENCGILCRIPNWWRKRNTTFVLTVKMGEDKPSTLGLDALLHMAPSLTIGGVPLTDAEIRDLLSQTEGLSFIKGKWIEVNHEKLKKLLDEMKRYDGEITLLDALRSEMKNARDDKESGTVITNGKWLGGLLKSLRSPRKLKGTPVPADFNGELRPYQEIGYQWLLQMKTLGFGACLADDMGLGKTVQLLAFLEALRVQKPNGKVLLIVPASLLGNWQKEAERFTPELSVEILHGAHAPELFDRFMQSKDFLTITTYRMAMSIEALEKPLWDCIILDEAQAIKNPATKQTRQIKKLKSRMRIAMTGTPIENDLSNLWSLFDFLNKGLLGSMAEFKAFCRGLERNPEGYAKLRNMIAPFLLRRVKTDKKIISDLPDKLEQVDYVALSPKQTVLYRKLLAETREKVLSSDGMQRRGLVLSLLLHLKQICNHPDQYLGTEEYSPVQSGKFELLRQIAQTIAEKRERVLVFTQFRELTPHLDDYLAEVFGRRGGVIHGGVPVKQRNEIVDRFQSDGYVPYLVLSVKAGGTGLNLTNANHVIHFDRWWNPSVENQATDRAFRIGQEKNVMVHKFVCKGSVEEKIDALISSKKELAENVIGSGGESWITEMSNDELMNLLRLEA
ncbi:MAG: DEAD/DEAH box helicase [Ruminococcus sp.]|nr:DEAD/DEAH box helicase [Ruminococcus sp.]